MRCADNKDRECNDECAAYVPDEEYRGSEMIWDTCTKQYAQVFTMVRCGPFCKRLGWNIGTESKLVKKNGEDVNEEGN